MEQITTCKDCEFAERVGNLPDKEVDQMALERSSYFLSQAARSGITGHCLNPDAPIYDYVHGFRRCAVINNNGKCQFFQPPSKPEPIKKVYKFPGIIYNHMEKVEITGLSEICRGLEVISGQLERLNRVFE